MKMRSVLFVDDDAIVLQSLERGLLEESYNKFFAKNCEEAFEIIRQEEINVIVTDMCMPEMSGLELLRTVKNEHPDIIGIVLSGYEKDADLKAAFDEGEIFRIIKKPWKLGGTNFENIVRQALDQYDLENKKGGGGSRLSKLKKLIKLGSDK